MIRLYRKHEKVIHALSFASINILNSLWIFYVYLLIAPVGSYPPANFSNILEGTADRPFVYRRLIPATAKVLSSIIPDELVDYMNDSSLPIKIVFERLRGETYAKEAIVTLLIIFLSLVGFGFAEKIFIKDLGLSGKNQFIVPLFAQAMILPLTYHFGFYYDLPQILLVALCLIYLYRQNWLAYLFFFTITTLNKETSVTLLLVYSIYYFSRIPRKEFVKLFLVQVMLYTIIRVVLIFLYQNNPGANIPEKIGTQLHIYTTYPIILAITLFVFGVIFFFIIKRWKQNSQFLRSTLIIFVVISILFFTSGIPMEFRVFLDALPVLAIWIFPFTIDHVA